MTVDKSMKYWVILGVTALVALGAGTFVGWEGAANTANTVAAIKQAEYESVASELEQTKEKLATAEAALEPQESVTRREDTVSRAELAVKTREDNVSMRETNVEEREAALVQEWWIAEVRECLSREADYKSADVTVSSYSGGSLSCYTG